MPVACDTVASYGQERISLDLLQFLSELLLSLLLFFVLACQEETLLGLPCLRFSHNDKAFLDILLASCEKVVVLTTRGLYLHLALDTASFHIFSTAYRDCRQCHEGETS